MLRAVFLFKISRRDECRFDVTAKTLLLYFWLRTLLFFEMTMRAHCGKFVERFGGRLQSMALSREWSEADAPMT